MSTETTAGAPPLGDLLAPLREAPDRSAILCDVDGTLAPIAQRAHEASVPSAQRRVLGELSQRYALCACISGRGANDARRLVGVGRLTYIGNHGLETLHPNAREPELAPEVAPYARAAEEFVAGLDVGELRRLKLRVEDKGSIWALHWRGAPDEARAAARAAEIAEDARQAGLVPHFGRKVLEFRPPVGIDKGTAVSALLSRAGVANALYGGDDRTDIDAFRALDELTERGQLEAGVRVAVHSQEGPEDLFAAADVVVDGISGYLGVLRHLAGTD